MNIIFKKLKIKNILLKQKEWNLSIDPKKDYIEFEIDNTHIIRVNFSYIIKIFGVDVCIYEKNNHSVFGEDFVVSNTYYLLFNPYLICRLYRIRKKLKSIRWSQESMYIISHMPQSLIRNNNIDNLLN